MKQCLFCGISFLPTGRNQKYCCKDHQYQHSIYLGVRKEYRDRANEKQGKVVGIGSGKLTPAGPHNHAFSHGRFSFRNFARKLKDQGVPCNRCGIDLRNVKRGEWCGHHIDHDDTNNNLNNLELLCKKCHQIHHESYLNFKNVQRLDRKIVGNSIPEAQSPSIEGDDIV